MNQRYFATVLFSLFLALSGCTRENLNSDDSNQEELSRKTTVENNDKAANYKLQGDLEKALSEYKLIAKNTESDSSLISEGNTLMTLGRFEEACLPLKNACEKNSFNPKSFALCDYILCLTALKKYDEALKNIDRCGTEFNAYSDFVATRAFCLMALNRNEEALLRLEQLSRDNPDLDARTYYLRSILLKKLNRLPEAKRALNIATLIYPDAIKMKSGKRLSPITTPLYADCAELFLKLDRPDRAVQTVALADVLGERGVRMQVVDSIARAKIGNNENLQKTESLIEKEKQFWKDLK